MENCIRWLLFKDIYNELNLKIFEDQLKSIGIQPQNLVSENFPLVSQYFFLQNPILFEQLSVEENAELKKMYEDFMNSNMQDDTRIIRFLKSVRFKLLFPKTDEKYLIWDFDDSNHMAPSDAVVLSFYYKSFNMNYADDVLDKMYCILNQIQDLSRSNEYKVAVFEYTERLLKARIL